MDVVNLYESLAQLIGQVVLVGGGATLIAYQAFKYLAKAWIDNRFNERLDALKHDQAKELQRLRIQIDALLSGTLKLQEREFMALPEAWKLLEQTKARVEWFVSPTSQHPDLDRMNSDQLEEYLAGSKLTGTQRNEIRNADNKLDTYIRIEFWHRLSKVEKQFFELRTYMASQAIFFPDDLKGMYDSIIEKLWSSIVARRVSHEADDHSYHRKAWEAARDEVNPLFKQIEALTRSRLRSHASTLQ
ncbi:hypothetical protein [Cupriavidus sp. HPC(L)]|uniref:hypothetical protein n=1 Tax=Cupriavidus sp. HPC(L) TaxID=1217418 RepID=UPI000290FA27|nr:hypothetical protein [Cupriavidus sp. HPC(L)]